MKKLIYPSYYKTFRCTADQCPDTCCRGWNIEIDEEIYKKWQHFQSAVTQPDSRSIAAQLDSQSITAQLDSQSITAQLDSRSIAPQSDSRSIAPQSDSWSIAPQSDSQSFSYVPESIHLNFPTEEIPSTCNLLNHMKTTSFGASDIRHTIAMDETEHCPMLTKHGLCTIVLRHGDDMLPKICREFPRQEINTDAVLSQGVAIRCPAVLDLLWEEDNFSYETEGEITSGEYPSKDLLDGLLHFVKISDRIDNQTSIASFSGLSSAAYLRAIFLACLDTHEKLQEYVPADENGYKEFGQEMIKQDSIAITLRTAEEILAQTHYLPSAESDSVPDLRICHDMMYEIMSEFFKSPVFGKEFTELFYQSQDLLRMPEEEQWRLFREVPLTPDTEKKLLLVIEEELFNEIFTVEVCDYETVLVRLQWLILRYLVIRYMIYLDCQNSDVVSVSQLRHRILSVFRVTDLPDIVKISYFDTSFKNWMWNKTASELELLSRM